MVLGLLREPFVHTLPHLALHHFQVQHDRAFCPITLALQVLLEDPRSLLDIPTSACVAVEAGFRYKGFAGKQKQLSSIAVSNIISLGKSAKLLFTASAYICCTSLGHTLPWISGAGWNIKNCSTSTHIQLLAKGLLRRFRWYRIFRAWRFFCLSLFSACWNSSS